MIKKIILTSGFLLLTACGFTPMHAPSLGEDGAAFKNIRVDLVKDAGIKNDEGAFWIQQALYDRLGTSGKAHVLSVTPKFNRGALGISSQDIATRYDLNAQVSYVLTDAKSGDVLDRGSVSATSTFASPIDPYSRAASEQNATQNLAKEAADRVLIRLAAYYANAEK